MVGENEVSSHIQWKPRGPCKNSGRIKHPMENVDRLKYIAEGIREERRW